MKEKKVIARKGNERFVFASALEAARYFGVSRIRVYDCIQSGAQTRNGITFDYLFTENDL